MARYTQDKELEQYRSLMEPPEHFEDGFTWKTVVGAVFLGMLIMPGSMYLSLVVGPEANMDTAARWVTIILFAEIARRSFKDLKMQEIYIFYYMAGLAMASPFQGLLWNQYLVQSDYANAMGVAQEIPSWWAPSAEVIREQGHTFFTKAWLGPIMLIIVGLLVSRLDQYGFGYVLYRITNDVEELPFPMAPVAAAGITALAQTKEDKERWRWRCFSIGAILGLTFGLFYIAIPSISGALLDKPIQPLPIPWQDFTPALSKILPATPLNISFNLLWFFQGMVLPFWAVIGGAFGVVFTMGLNPILYKYGVLSHWDSQMDVINTLYSNNVDFYLSFSLGLTLAITVVSLGKILTPMMNAWRNRRGNMSALEASVTGQKRESTWRRLLVNDPKRGDFSIWIALSIYVLTNGFWIGLSCWLIEGFPWHFFVFYALVLTPLLSYATAKLEGLCGQALSIPYIREATYILSGYKGVKIWFAPVPIPNYGVETVNFRVLELTGTKISSQIKTQIVTVPIIIVASIIFSTMLWSMAEVPSAAYPYAQKMWELNAKNTCLTFSSTMEGGSMFMEALRLKYVLVGLGSGVISFIVLSVLGLPTLLVFGMVRGLGQSTPSGVIFELLGALIGRFYFKKRFGDQWMKYTPILLAGFSCGMGLIGMVSVAFTILNKMMAPLVF
ncbi:MAG: OPT/YSL family transporter [Lentisphaeria bacterium]|nr:OPT/YSL family transporter [Lentisphaeria bacterium]